MNNSTNNQLIGLARRSPLPTLGALQDIFDSVLTASLQVDGVLAELENERAHLSELSAMLSVRAARKCAP